MSYVPLHDRVSNLPSGPRYASPDLDPLAPLKPPQAPPDEVAQEAAQEDGGEPSRKRRREESPSARPANNGHHQQSHPQSQSQSRSQSQSHASSRAPPPPSGHVSMDTVIQPSIFGIAPRNEFTKVVGEFIMHNSRELENVEIEIKLGKLHAAADGQPLHRIRMPTQNETIMPPDYPVGPFMSSMNRKQHASLNVLLNEAVEGSRQTPTPLHFYRAKHIDSFYSSRGGKTRVSRDENGNVVENGVVRKRRIADLNIYSPREAFDWRVSVSVEDPAEMPSGTPVNVRSKDRACYRHQLCQVDLTAVNAKQDDRSFELEIEIVDVPALIAEGLKEERGEENRFDEILQSVLDTTRMLIRNV